eukprot:3362855-Alexandrium_andersonii.AAC.1
MCIRDRKWASARKWQEWAGARERRARAPAGQIGGSYGLVGEGERADEDRWTTSGAVGRHQ